MALQEMSFPTNAYNLYDARAAFTVAATFVACIKQTERPYCVYFLTRFVTSGKLQYGPQGLEAEFEVQTASIAVLART